MTAHCTPCATRTGMAFECLKCCIRWLSRMTREEIAINAPVIEIVAGKDHMEKVRTAWRERK